MAVRGARRAVAVLVLLAAAPEVAAAAAAPETSATAPPEAVPAAAPPEEGPPAEAVPAAPAEAVPAAAPPEAPASQLIAPLTQGTMLQPADRGYKSPAIGAGLSFGATLLPIIIGGFAVRTQSEAAMWAGFGLIVTGQSFGPSTGFWYAGERPRFTWPRLALSVGALGAAVYPLYAYTGLVEEYNGPLAAALTVVAAAAEAVALALAAWDLSLLGETIERHNFRPTPPPASRPSRARLGARAAFAPLVMPRGAGLQVGGTF